MGPTIRHLGWKVSVETISKCALKNSKRHKTLGLCQTWQISNSILSQPSEKHLWQLKILRGQMMMSDWVLSAKKLRSWCCTVFQIQEKKHLKDYFPNQKQLHRMQHGHFSPPDKNKCTTGLKLENCYEERTEFLTQYSQRGKAPGGQGMQTLFSTLGSSTENNTKLGRQVSRNFITKI